MPETDTFTRRLGAITALVAAIASAAAGASAFFARSTQDKVIDIDKRQQLLDQNDWKGNEKDRIGGLYVSTGGKVTCSGIPNDETEKWDRYCSCMFKTQGCSTDPKSPPPFKTVDNVHRQECLTQQNLCH